MKPADERIEIPFSRKKIFLLLVVALLFVAIGAWVMLTPGRHSALQQLLGGITALFFGLCAYLLVRKLPNQKTGLVIDAAGLTNFSNAKSPQYIPWSDMEDMWVLRIQNRKTIMVQVRNPEYYIGQQENAFTRKMMQLRHRMYGTPLSITANPLKISFDKLWQLLAEKFKEAHGL